jgi:hypothetical protein
VKWSVGLEAEAGQVLTREQVVELADAVAPSSGIATGIGSTRYGTQLVVEADGRDEAVELATREFTRAAVQAGLPLAPIVRVEAVSEAEDEAEEEAAAEVEAAAEGEPGAPGAGPDEARSGGAKAGAAEDTGAAGDIGP